MSWRDPPDRSCSFFRFGSAFWRYRIHCILEKETKSSVSAMEGAVSLGLRQLRSRVLAIPFIFTNITISKSEAGDTRPHNLSFLSLTFPLWTSIRRSDMSG